MDYRFMGRTGLKVSELCLGTQTFGWVTDEVNAQALADHFVEAGGNFFDTSNTYNRGQSELNDLDSVLERVRQVALSE